MNRAEIDNVVLEDVHEWDAPDYCDAYIASADYQGKPMTEEQLEEINEDTDLIYEQIQNSIH